MSEAFREGRPGLMPLWREAHRRFSRGNKVERLTIAIATSQESAALADFFGFDSFPDNPLRISVSEVEKALAAGGYRSLREVVSDVLGPIGDQTKERLEQEESRANLWRELSAHPLVRDSRDLQRWAEAVSAAGVAPQSVPAMRERLQRALRVLDALPDRGGVGLAEFAARVLGNPHALDEGKSLSTLVIKALSAQLQIPWPSSSEERRFVWERFGVAPDAISSSVLVAGRWYGTGVVAEIIDVCQRNAQCASITLAQLETGSVVGPASNRMWVVENPSVIAAGLKAFGVQCPPMVCVSGWPSVAALRLLDGGCSPGVELRYHGDFDPGGLRIAGYLRGRYGASLWRMGVEEYRRGVMFADAELVDLDRDRLRQLDFFDSRLVAEMLQHGKVVFEEQVMDSLLQDLRNG